MAFELKSKDFIIVASYRLAVAVSVLRISAVAKQNECKYINNDVTNLLIFPPIQVKN